MINWRAYHLSILTSIILALIFLLSGCKKDNDDSTDDTQDTGFFSEYSSRKFHMGFTTWPYAATNEAVFNTYQFLNDHADIYSEHIDSEIPWDALINGKPLPKDFTDEMEGKFSKRIPGVKLTVSVSILNTSRNDLAPGMDGKTPVYDSINEIRIEDAYVKHLEYIANLFQPDYFLIAIEVNELLKNSPNKWERFKRLMSNVRARVKTNFPGLTISESITLHNFYNVDVPNPNSFIDEVANYANMLDLATISFYPYFNGLDSKEGFQDAFDFLHNKVSKPIAFAETGHLSEDLNVASFNLSIPGNEAEQNEYLEILSTNAQKNNYEYIIWWTHRDYDDLWQTFPPEVKDIGKLWLSTGILNEDGREKTAYTTWNKVLSKSFK